MQKKIDLQPMKLASILSTANSSLQKLKSLKAMGSGCQHLYSQSLK